MRQERQGIEQPESPRGHGKQVPGARGDGRALGDSPGSASFILTAMPRTSEKQDRLSHPALPDF